MLTPQYAITTQRALRAAFWEAHPHAVRKRTRYAVDGWTRHVDTRCAFVDYVDMLARDGTISEALAQRATLD